MSKLWTFSFLVLISFVSSCSNAQNLRTYIVHVHPPSLTLAGGGAAADSSSELRESWYKSFLPPTIASDTDTDANSHILYSYHSVISGFAARLTESDLASMRAKLGFVSAYPDQFFTIQTTHTPEFLGLNRILIGSIWNESNLGRGVIIGMLDTGILPTHPSFIDDGMPLPPPKWKGKCEFSPSQCNKKLIGARVLIRGATGANRTSGDTPLDLVGHGTHTSSTAAGRSVENAGVLGSASGTAVGMAPMAHLAMYKVCLGVTCVTSDILAGMDAAVADGVDVISVSLGGAQASQFHEDGVAVGAFGAVEKGIFVTCAAGNLGSNESTVLNDAPWIMTVGASTTDRSFRMTVGLGNGEEFDGVSLFQSNESVSMSPLVYPGAVDPSSAFCNNGSLDGIDVKGKVVLCDSGGSTTKIAKGSVVKSAGGVAMILANSPDKGFTRLAEAHKLPASHVSFSAALKIKAYMNHTKEKASAAIIPKGTVIGGAPGSPMVGAFSSRGPSLVSKGILKPDIIGPGVDVLAAWPLLPIGPSSINSLFNVISGTSMAAPHLSGIAMLLKSVHPDWSPAMIRSAIMTTAETTDNAGRSIADHTLKLASLFAMGAGHVNPNKANKPGLVYDIKPDEYIRYMCGISMTDMQVSAVARRVVNCMNVAKIAGDELNYPSFLVNLVPGNNFTRSVTRTVINVGGMKESYIVEIVRPSGVSVKVMPEKLEFSEMNEKKMYAVEFAVSERDEINDAGYSEGSLSWISSDKNVKVIIRSPVVISFH